MEKYIIGSNSSGKTRKMLEMARDDDVIVVCKNPYSMEEKAKSYGIFGLEFIGYDNINNSPIYGKKLAIDELGEFFKHCYGAKLNSFTMTVD